MVSISDSTCALTADSAILTFDVGGSHIAAGLFSPAELTLGEHKNVLVSNEATMPEVLAQFSQLAASLNSRQNRIGVAVSMPSPFDYDDGISYMQHKYKHLYGRNLRLGLAECLNCHPATVHFLNDASAFLIGELHQGAAAGISRAVGITLGTGVGSAFAVDGEIVTDLPSIPSGGEIWNFPYKDGMLEDAISTRAIQRCYQERTNLKADVRKIGRLAACHDSQALTTFQEFGSELGRALRITCVPFDPARIVLGGGIAKAAHLFVQAAEAELLGTSVQLCVSALMDRAPLLGAAVSWMKNHRAEEFRQKELHGNSHGR